MLQEASRPLQYAGSGGLLAIGHERFHMSTSGIREDGAPQPSSSHQNRSFSKGSEALSSLPPSEIGKEPGQTQTEVGDTFLAVLQTTPQGSYAHHDVWVAQAGDVRSVGASTAVQARMDIKGIMEAANWQRLSTLQRYYFKPQSLQSLSNILNVTS